MNSKNRRLSFVISILMFATLMGTNAINISTLSSPENFSRNEYIWANLVATLATKK